jgi:toxin ParE1/3/4
VDFRLSSAADSDIEKIVDRYANVSTGLAARFVHELDACLRDLCASPDIGSLRYAWLIERHRVRVWQLYHFPYLVFYRVDPTFLRVLRILHERRKLSARLISPSMRG